MLRKPKTPFEEWWAKSKHITNADNVDKEEIHPLRTSCVAHANGYGQHEPASILPLHWDPLYFGESLQRGTERRRAQWVCRHCGAVYARIHEGDRT